MLKKAGPDLTQRSWLDRLCKRLIWYFPVCQVREILADFRDQFQTGRDRGKPDGEIIEALGTPAEAAAQLLEEEPAARAFRWRQSALWGALLAFCFAFLWVSAQGGGLLPLYSAGSCLFIPAAASALFLLLRGPARVSLEGWLPLEKRVSPLPGFCLPLAAVVLFEAVEQLLLAVCASPNPLSFPVPEELGLINTYLIMVVAAGMALLAAWLLYRSVSVSIGSFPGIPHAVGALGSTFFSYAMFHSLSVEDNPLSLAVELLLCLLPYFSGLATALAFRRWVDGRAPLPALFQEGPVTRQGWLNRLGRLLLGWFPVEQAAEILSDYQEQIQIGLERGRPEEAILSELGRPEIVVRDLLAEDRKARLRRRRIWPWVVGLAAGAWLLLGLLRAFEFGFGGWRCIYSGEYTHWLSAAAVVLTGVCLFNLLRGRDRARLEGRFPPEKRPSVWIFLPPLLLSALVGSAALYVAYKAHDFWQSSGDLPYPMGWWVAISIEFSVLLLFLVLIWTVARCLSGSIRYLPAAVHAAGSMAHLLCMGIIFHVMDVTSPLSPRDLLPALAPYGAGAALAIALGLVIRRWEKR